MVAHTPTTVATVVAMLVVAMVATLTAMVATLTAVLPVSSHLCPGGPCPWPSSAETHVCSLTGYPGYAYDEDNAYQQYASQEQYRQWADYAAQQQYEDSAAQADYYNWAAANSYKGKHQDVLKVADKHTNKLVYMGDMEFGGYKHEITGGNDGGYNAPFDINGDGQEIDNWAKVLSLHTHSHKHTHTHTNTHTQDRKSVV